MATDARGGRAGRVRCIAREAAASKKTAAPSAPSPAPSAKASGGDAPKKLSYNEKRELTMLEERIAEAEARQPELEAELAEHATDAEKVVALSKEFAALNAQLEADVDHWAELAERA